MTASAPFAVLAVVEPVFTDPERLGQMCGAASSFASGSGNRRA